MKRLLRVVPWVGLAFVFLTAFGPFTNTIYRTWTGTSLNPDVLNVSVSPTAQATQLVPYANNRYAYGVYPSAAASPAAFACCSYSSANATPASTPAVSGSNCATGLYVGPNVPFVENVAPNTGLWCVASGGTITYQIVEDK